ncbi:MAG: hypothetical protein WBH47_24385 [Streptosporangiaceae bacterium]
MTDSHRDGQFAPNPFPDGDRRTNVVEEKIAHNTVRRGRETVWEGTGGYYGEFAGGGFQEARSGATPNPERPGNFVAKKYADGRGPVGSGQPMEHWTDEGSYLGAFAQGTARPTATSRSERPGTIYQKVYAPPNGGRGVRNDAERTG